MLTKLVHLHRVIDMYRPKRYCKRTLLTSEWLIVEPQSCRASVFTRRWRARVPGLLGIECFCARAERRTATGHFSKPFIFQIFAIVALPLASTSSISHNKLFFIKKVILWQERQG